MSGGAGVRSESDGRTAAGGQYGRAAERCRCFEVRRRGPGDPRGGEAGPARPGPAELGPWESAAYWLLYVVAFTAALLHWNGGNHLLALVCAAAVAFSVRLITRT